MANIALIALGIIKLLFICSAQELTDEELSYLETALKESTNSEKVTQRSPRHLSDPRVKLQPHFLIAHYGYKGEEHTVETSDGYVLKVHRVAGNRKNLNDTGKPVVLLQHGFQCSSMHWIITGPNRSLALILADLGFDVWMPNSRGNKYSRDHKTLKPGDRDFFDYSWHELGIYDLPATIDYILMKTGNSKITYVGYSQGTTISYVLLSELPKYNDKIAALFSLAPVSFSKHINPIFQGASKLNHFLKENLYFYDIYEVDNWNKRLRKLFTETCNFGPVLRSICRKLMFLIVGESEEQFDEELYTIIHQQFPAGASIKQVDHFGQLVKSGRFHQYDYGREENLKIYGSEIPPDYKIQNIKVPTTLFYADNDLLANPRDVKSLYEKLPNKNGLIKVNHTTFNHFDYLWGKDVKKLVYDKLISLILKNKNHV